MAPLSTGVSHGGARWGTPAGLTPPAEWFVTRRGLIMHTPGCSCSERGRLVAVSWPCRACALVYARKSHVDIAAEHSASSAPSKAEPQGLGRHLQPQWLLFGSHLVGTCTCFWACACALSTSQSLPVSTEADDREVFSEICPPGRPGSCPGRLHIGAGQQSRACRQSGPAPSAALRCRPPSLLCL